MSRAQLRGLSGSLPHHVRINSSICSCVFRPLSTSLAAGIRGHGPAVQSNYPARLSITYARDELASLQGNSGRLLVQRSTSADICISMIYGLNDLALLQIQAQQRSTRRLRLHQTAESEVPSQCINPGPAKAGIGIPQETLSKPRAPYCGNMVSCLLQSCSKYFKCIPVTCVHPQACYSDAHLKQSLCYQSCFVRLCRQPWLNRHLL